MCDTRYAPSQILLFTPKIPAAIASLSFASLSSKARKLGQFKILEFHIFSILVVGPAAI